MLVLNDRYGLSDFNKPFIRIIIAIKMLKTKDYLDLLLIPLKLSL